MIRVKGTEKGENTLLISSLYLMLIKNLFRSVFLLFLVPFPFLYLYLGDILSVQIFAPFIFAEILSYLNCFQTPDSLK